MRARLILFLALLLACTGAALAQTPDGETPAEETVCDGETGAAYGLCNAYCEAMDCESDEPAASETACTKVRTRFQNITGHDMPCEAVSCPCSGQPAWEGALVGTGVRCFGSASAGQMSLSTTTGLAETFPGVCQGISVAGFVQMVATPEEVAACIAVLSVHCPPED